MRIIYACESGSRAWGFASTDSDYDVRFLYVHPTNWYLAIDQKSRRDVIERPIDAGLDISGWDLRKALLLFQKSNPPLLEWLGSPVVYLEAYTTAARLREMAPVCYSPIACRYHYFRMAKRNYREFLRGEQVWLKKYFYVLRPVLGVIWLERDLGVVPTEFEKLVSQTVESAELKTAIRKLLAAKMAGGELKYGPRISAINDFLERELLRMEALGFHRLVDECAAERLNEVFRAALVEVWGSA